MAKNGCFVPPEDVSKAIIKLGMLPRIYNIDFGAKSARTSP